MTNTVALAKGTKLVDDYRVERVLGAGGFGITYLAEETPLARLVTIKEYFPVDFAARDAADDVCPRSQGSEGDYKWGLDRFIEEAQTLAKFSHPNIVRVYRYFRARKTGYIVLHFEEGASFKGWLKGLGRAPRQQELDAILVPLLDALEVIHTADFLHRDIAPDNIMIRKDGSPVLIDFGSARGDIAKHTKTLSALVKPGYSPYEQYATTSTRQGPWTDIYSLGATLYQAVTGKRPPDAPTRMVSDEMVPVRDAALSSYRPGFVAAIDHALRLDMAARPQSVAAWRAELMAPAKKAASWTGRRKAKAEPEPVIVPPPMVTPELQSAAHREAIQQPAPAMQHGTLKPTASSLPSRGLLGSFMDGWRKAAPPAEPAAIVLPASLPPPITPPTSGRRLLPTGPPPLRRAQATADPGERKAPPRALRIRSSWPWKSMAAKLVIGVGIAAAAVSMQDRMLQAPGTASGITTGQLRATDTGPLGQLKGHRGAINAIGFTGDGRNIVSTAADGTLKLWNAATRSLIRSLDLDNGPATAMAVSIDGRRAVTGHKDGAVAIWDLDAGTKLASFRRNEQAIASVTFAGDPSRVAAAAQDRVIAVWDASTPSAPVHVLEGHEGAAESVAFSVQGRHLASGSADRTVKLWKAEGATLVRTYRGHGDLVSALAFTPDGAKLASASLDGEIRIWSTRSSRQHYAFRGHQGRVAALAFAPDNEVLASASDDGSIRLWSVKQGRSLRTLGSQSGELRAVSFKPDGRELAAAGKDGLVRLYSAAVHKPGI